MTQSRYYAIDHLRTSMMFVVVFGHPLLPYVTVPRSFKDPSAQPAFDVVAVFLYAFAMPAFFVTAGFAAALLLERKGSSGLWRNRFQRIFLPLLIAYILLSPLMRGSYEFAKAVVEFDSISAGWDVFATGEWIRWSKLYHLWFLLSLLLFTALAMAFHSMLKRFNFDETVSDRVADRLAGYGGMLRLWILASLTTIPSYVAAAGSGTHWSMQITLFGFFSLGWFLYQQPGVIESWRERWQLPLIVSIAIIPVCAYVTRARLFEESVIDPVLGSIAGATNAAIGVAMTVALVGWYHAKLDRQSRIGEALGRASYWAYLVHFPVVVAAGGLVSVLDIPAILKYLITVAIAVPIIALSYIAIVRRFGRA